MLRRKESGAVRKSGKALRRSRSSSGRPAMVEEPRGEDLAGREGLKSES